ncbi:MAG: thymidine kinase, partial [uncultured bacterium]
MSAENSSKKGSLEVICGPMFSGKSEELIRRLRRAQIAKQNVLTCKHSLDNRYMIECIISHDGKKLEAEAIGDVHDI